MLFLVLPVFAASLPYTVVYNIEDFATGYRSCVISKWYREYLIIYFSGTMLFLVLPVFAIGIVSVCIIHKISRQKTIAYGRGVERKEQGRQLTIILLLISISYIILYFPLLITYVLKYVKVLSMNRVNT